MVQHVLHCLYLDLYLCRLLQVDIEVEEAATAVAGAVEKLRSVQGPPGVGPVVVYGS